MSLTRTPKMLVASILVLVALLALPGLSLAESPGTIEWKANNKIYDAHGQFQSWHFTRVTIPDGNLEKGVVEMEIDLASVSEKTEALAEHLRTADFFNVETFAKATVKIDRIEKAGENSYTGVATLTMHGHTNEVPISFDVVSTSPLTIKGTATVSRTAFGIGEPYDASNDRSIIDGIEVMISATVEN